MAVDLNEVDSAINGLIKKLRDFIGKDPNPTPGDIKNFWDINSELAEQAELDDKDVDEIMNIFHRSPPDSNQDYFDKLMYIFKQQHFKRLQEQENGREAKIDKQKKEQGKIKKNLHEIKTSIVNIFGPRSKNPDQDSDEAGEAKGKKYYYVWWLFDNENDFNTIANDPHAYPRRRGGLKVYYKEIGTKDITEALAGEKSTGKVTGEFLGALGMVDRNIAFEDIVPLVNLQEGQIISLGAARARKIDFSQGIIQGIRGFKKNGLMKFDVERLLWKWDRWHGTGDAGKKEKSAKSKKRKDEDILGHLDKEVKKWMKEVGNDAITTLKWHDKYQLEDLRKIYEDLNDISLNHPEFRKNPQFLNKMKQTQETLLKAIEAWGKNEPEKLKEIRNVRDIDLLNDIVWLEKAVSYLKNNAPK